MFWILITACGQYVSADAELAGVSGSLGTSSTELPSRDELATATTLRYYGLEGLTRFHVEETDWNGGDARLFDYEGVLASPEAALTHLDTMTNLASVDPSTLADGEERLAFWINVYNVWTIEGVLRQLSQDPAWDGVSSTVWDGTDTGVTFAMFSVAYAEVGGTTMTLNQIEHGVIRGDSYALENYFDSAEDVAQAEAWHEEIWGGEPINALIHMGLNCASMGCPDIEVGAFQSDTLWTQLEAGAVRYTDHPGKGAGPQGLSELFSWFKADFEGSHGGVQAFVSEFRTGGDADVDYDSKISYDWTLNTAN